jgi:hypothetical protein
MCINNFHFHFSFHFLIFFFQNLQFSVPVHFCSDGLTEVVEDSLAIMYHLSYLFTVQDGLELDHYYPFISAADNVAGPLLTDESKFVVKTTSYSYTTISDSAEGGENMSNYVQLTGHLSIWSGSALNETKVRSFTLFFSASNTCF